MTEELKLELIRKEIKDYKLLPVKDMYKAFPCFYRVDESQLSLVDDYIAKRTIKDEFGTNEEPLVRIELNLINKQLKDLNDRKDELLRKLRWYSSLLPNKNVTLDDIYDEDL